MMYIYEAFDMKGNKGAMKYYSALGSCPDNIHSGLSTFEIFGDIFYHFEYTVSRFPKLYNRIEYSNKEYYSPHSAN